MGKTEHRGRHVVSARHLVSPPLLQGESLRDGGEGCALSCYMVASLSGQSSPGLGVVVVRQAQGAGMKQPEGSWGWKPGTSLLQCFSDCELGAISGSVRSTSWVVIS